MIQSTIDPEPLSVYQVLSEARYIIPIYQRNYAWTRIEIDQLLADIFHQYNINKESLFYIGTLTVKARGADLFEVIDGQQRHTTLNLVKAVIRHDFTQIDHGPSVPNLSFEARALSNEYLISLMTDFSKSINNKYDEASIHSLQNGCRDIRRFLKGSYIPRTEVASYLNYLLNNVMIIRVPVPEGTDLNHYFEIMNSRGEQLEQHEILKAELMSKLLQYNEETRASFAEIWDACSQMDQYLPFCFESKKRSALFGPDLKASYTSLLVAQQENIQDINNRDITNKDAQAEHSLLHTLKNHIASKTGIPKPTEESSRFRSIIDFPNFLLQVLQQFYPTEEISFDDKHLLREFGCTTGSVKVLPDPIAFINFLFFNRICFDRYIIKREEGSNDWNWKILQANTSGSTLSNTFADQRELVMIQAMFHVTQPGNTYKNWLRPLMAYLNQESLFESVHLLRFLQAQASQQILVYLKQLDLGTQTPIFCFNLLDYKLWRIYYRLQQDLTVAASHLLSERIAMLPGVFYAFRFTQNNSVEHVAPQTTMEGEAKAERIDEFGNLCLISRSSNSRLINLPFSAKKSYFSSDSRKSVESLKQAIIFTYPAWTDEEIRVHGDMMRDLLISTEW
jgi:hypothetical protein